MTSKHANHCHSFILNPLYSLGKMKKLTLKGRELPLENLNGRPIDRGGEEPYINQGTSLAKRNEQVFSMAQKDKLPVQCNENGDFSIAKIRFSSSLKKGLAKMICR